MQWFEYITNINKTSAHINDSHTIYSEKNSYFTNNYSFIRIYNYMIPSKQPPQLLIH